MISIRALTECPCQAICKAWPLATISIRALTEWLCQTICKVYRTSGNDFNQSLDRVHLPSNLQSLTFSDAFNRSLDSPWLSLWICKVWALDCVLNHGKSLINGGFNGKIIYKSHFPWPEGTNWSEHGRTARQFLFMVLWVSSFAGGTRMSTYTRTKPSTEK